MSYTASQTVAQTSVVLLAAGRGQRMMPLTSDTPKPLLKLGQHALIEHHLYALAEQGFKHVVINLAYLGDKIRNTLGDGSNYGVSIEYSDESDSGALETAGGLRKALPLIRSAHMLVINADIWTDYRFAKLVESIPEQSSATLGRLVMVENPPHNETGDFAILPDGKLSLDDRPKSTFSGIARYHQEMFSNLATGKQALAPVFRDLIAQQRLQAELHRGEWFDIGTPERLEKLNKTVSNRR